MKLVDVSLLLLLALLVGVVAAFGADDELFLQLEEDAAREEERFEYVGSSHYEFGLRMGERFEEKIRQRLQGNAKLQGLLLPYARTEEGKKLYKQYLDTHSRTFPQYVAELQGIADGSNVPFEIVFIENLSEEFEDSIPASFNADVVSASEREPTLRCSDVVLTSSSVQVVAHNEDSGAQDVNRTAIITAQIGNEPKFVAYTYLGDLPSGAFGFNSAGIAFTLNFVQPAETFVCGLGRGFISRDLLAAHDTDDAIARITRTGQAAGHNFQLMDVLAARIWNIEVASFDRHAIHEFQSNPEDFEVTASFHANQYQRLDIPQPPYQSSLHRLKRYSEMQPPTNIVEALRVLGDQQDHSYPVFHDATSHEHGELSGWTLTTIVFDLPRRKAVSFRGNPRNHNVKLVWDLSSLKVEAPVKGSGYSMS